MARKTEKVLGYDIDLISLSGAVDFVMGKILKREGIQVVTVNPEIMAIAAKNQEYSRILRHADLVVPDGSGITLALKLKGIEQEQVPGIDLAYELIKTCRDMKYSVALIGAKEEVLQTTKKRLEAEFRGLDICFCRNGYFSNEKEEGIINQLDETDPQLVLVALGAPKQELFIKKCREKIKYAAFIGVGGSFDVWAGAVERAPEFFRVMGWEWIYRTFKQPQRIKRIYKVLPVFLFKVIIEAIRTNGIFVKRKSND